jgi:hypothetical protein
MLKLNTEAIKRLIAAEQENAKAAPTAQSTVYLLALKPEGFGQHGERLKLLHRLANFAAEFLQPGRPTMIHCELLIPSRSKPGIFSTYSNSTNGADWRFPQGEEKTYYLSSNVHSWVAVPIRVSSEQLRDITKAADDACGAPYSFFNYALACPGIRSIAPLFVRGGGKRPGHCGNISSRVLKQGLPRDVLPRHEIFYGPSLVTKALHTHMNKTHQLTEKVKKQDFKSNAFPEFSKGFTELCEDADVASTRPAPGKNCLLLSSNAEIAAIPGWKRLELLETLENEVFHSQTAEERESAELRLARGLFRSQFL